MTDLLLTHGYFLFEDPKERQIMKPYAPLGILYLCSHLRNKGFDVDVFDTTFSVERSYLDILRTERPSVLGLYANLMTRRNIIEILGVAHDAGWKTVVGGPEPGAYTVEYLQEGADFVVSGEGELTMEELASWRCAPIQQRLSIQDRRCFAYLERKEITPEPATGANCRPRPSAVACTGGNRYAALCRHLAQLIRQDLST